MPNHGFPDTVAVWQLSAYRVNADKDIFISGLWDFVDFMPYEPSNYCYEDIVVLAPHEVADPEDDDNFVTVSAMALHEQTKPKAYGMMLADDRLAELQEMEYAN